jgi:hypothetical protein
MKKILAGLLTVAVSLCLVTSVNAALSWAYAANLADWDASVQTGWFVQMYQDANGDTITSGISGFDGAGAPTGGNSSDDSLLGSFTDSTEDSKGDIVWGESIDNWSSLYGADVYSVLFNAASIGTASQGVVVDGAVEALGASDPYSYTQSTVANSWVGVVPEPTTIAFLGVGLVAFVLRKKIRS